MPQWQADAVLALLTLVTGSTYFISKIVLQTLDPFVFLALRFFISSLLLYMLFYKRIHQLQWSIFLPCLRVGIFLSVGIIMMTIGLQHSQSGQVSFIISMEVVLVPVFALLFYGERIDRLVLLGLPIAVTGLALLTLQAGTNINQGDIWVMASAFCFALYTIYNSRYAVRYDPVILAWVQVTMVAVVSSLGMLCFAELKLDINAAAVYGIAYLIVVATVIRFYVQTYAQRYTTATHTSLIFMLEPVVAALFGYAVLGEVLSAQAMWGCGLILVATFIAKAGYFSRRKPQSVCR
ncbi:DMT family transporter [Dasania marina]|uniref:DMT family transporter n=1 Tax=Dasania marina TaxID=471499 RepID=UPI0030DB3B02|tara:strand:- start:42356 stop:43234 length:879 start_codon:yes stop_codon:yes gene_type:complete